MIRAVLAATLSPVYGIYSGFELCENAALPGREEYLDSEKYQLKQRDWNAPGNIKGLVTALNRIRRENRALQELDNLKFLPAANDQILFFAKTTAALDNILLVAVNLDPWHAQSAWVELEPAEFGLSADETYQVHDLLTDERFLWHGRRNFIALDPHGRPAHVFRLRRRVAGDGETAAYA
jgi:starch synthase (maltosyl-transferring)